MSLFKKSNRKPKNQRTRVEDSDEDNHSIEADLKPFCDKNDNKFDSINDNLSKDFDDIYETKPMAKPNPKLSFDVEEEDCDVFKVKKSSYSRRLAKQSDNSHKKKKEIKKEIKETTNEDNNHSIKEELDVIWIKSEEIKENKSEVKEKLKIFAGDQIESDSEYEEYEESEEYKSNEPFHHFRGALERGVIPDAKTIYELKKQRQMARDLEELIIPVNDDESYEDIDSRIIREDDNDKSDDEEEDQRISFAINRDDIERERAREAFLFAQEEDEDQSEQESEDELDRWEREQIKKGVRMPVIQRLTQEQASNRAIGGLFIDNHTVIDMDIDRPFKQQKKSSSLPSKALNRFNTSVTIDEIGERVRHRLQIIKESIESKERQINSLNIDLNETKREIQRLSQNRQQLLQNLTKDQ